MKQRLFSFGLVLLLVLSLAACGNNGGGNQTSNEGENVLQEIKKANLPIALLEKYDSFQMDSENLVEGTKTLTCFETTEGGYNMLIRDDTTGIEVASTPQGNFVWASENDAVATLYQDPSEYEARKEEIVSAPTYAFRPTAEVKEYKEQDGKITVLAVSHMDAKTDGYETFCKQWGIEEETFDYCIEYVADSQTKELIENNTYCELSAGRKDLERKTFAYGDAFEMSDGLKKYMEASVEAAE